MIFSMLDQISISQWGKRKRSREKSKVYQREEKINDNYVRYERIFHQDTKE